MNFLSVINLPKEVKKVVKYLQELLEEKGLYDTSLDLQVMNVACQIVQYNKIITDFLGSTSIVMNPVTRTNGQEAAKKNPLLADSVNLSNSIRQNLKAIGLTLGDKASGMTKNNPLGSLINKLNEIDKEEEDNE